MGQGGSSEDEPLAPVAQVEKNNAELLSFLLLLVAALIACAVLVITVLVTFYPDLVRPPSSAGVALRAGRPWVA
jgi:hypothetical protein